jgi:RNA polymerase sigma-70 factor (ECF subfamily)
VGNTLELALIDRCRNGDRQAFAELLGQYQKAVYNAAYRIVGDPDDAADVTQAVFLKAFENLDRFDPKYRFFSWIYRIAVNESINHNKRGKRLQPLEEGLVPGGSGPDAAAQENDLSREIQGGLMKLKENYRTVVVLRHFSDFSYREISEILQIPEKTVKSRLYTARQLMRESLQGRGLIG